MRKVRFLGQAERVFPRLPLPVQVLASERLRSIAAGKDENAPGALGVADGTRLRYFTVAGYLFSYAAPRRGKETFWVLKIVRPAR